MKHHSLIITLEELAEEAAMNQVLIIDHSLQGEMTLYTSFQITFVIKENQHGGSQCGFSILY